MSLSSFEIQAICHFTGTLIISIEMMIFIDKYRQYNSHNRPTINENNEMVPFKPYTDNKWSFVFVMFCSIFFGLQNICTGMYLIEYNGINDNMSTFIWWGAKLVTLDCGKISTYCFLLNMLYFNFKNSPHSISLCVFIVYFISVSLYATRPVSIIGIGIYEYMNGNHEISVFNSDITFISLLCAICMEFIISTTLLVLFTRKLCKFGITVAAQYGAENMQEYSRLSKLIGLKQYLEEGIENLSLTASKIFILGGIIMILSELDSITTLVDEIKPNLSIWHMISLYMDFIGSLTQPLFLMLSFSFMNSWYKCCCYSCHNCIKDICTSKLGQNTDIILSDADKQIERLIVTSPQTRDTSCQSVNQ